MRLVSAPLFAAALLGVGLLPSNDALADGLDPAFEVGVHGGLFAFDALDVPNTSGVVVPRLGFWFNKTLGLELDVGISAGPADAFQSNFLTIAPQLMLVGDPVPHDDAKKVPVRPVLAIGAGTMLKSIGQEGVEGRDLRVEAMISVGPGLVVPIVGPLSFRTDVRMNTTVAREEGDYVSPFIDLSWTGGFQAVFGLAKDTDKDDIADVDDACPTDVEDVDGFEDADGCPEVDNDKDGVKDADDKAPNDAEDVDGFEDADGAPDLDNDADGTPDTEDACPLVAGGTVTAGCPDGDEDGVADKDDACPTAAGLAAFQGCGDADQDGVYDNTDACPDAVGPASTAGCADRDADGVADKDDACPDQPVATDAVDPAQPKGCPAPAPTSGKKKAVKTAL